ncbi:DUF3850 domain-containing protein [Schleiferilactobacillus shenzhenensis]|uniref:DUF3850 domain-containing protein n=1 Tax=Schleiferilactobacillus shenzhenensis LY-73 TaxID=1231336 RepID=U4TI61_9LACO|nr:DUF3850 domain-containing protein [Schleiferilactobacillus shenzhenensis]ERL63839.1 hypothetical protein L248_2132 [Schleiferilactobacillus shenzhenensis LY-73]
MEVQKLKILPEFFKAVLNGDKLFEIRRNDRDYQQGQNVELAEWDGKDYTGRSVLEVITYVTDYHQQPGYVVFGMRPID